MKKAEEEQLRQELSKLRDLYMAYLAFRDELMRQHMSEGVERMYLAGERLTKFYGEER